LYVIHTLLHVESNHARVPKGGAGATVPKGGAGATVPKGGAGATVPKGGTTVPKGGATVTGGRFKGVMSSIGGRDF